MLNICIVGGGNIGSLLIGQLGWREDVCIRVKASNPESWGNEMLVFDTFHDTTFSGKIERVSDKMEDVIPNADIILITLPSFLIEKTFEEMLPHVKSGAWIGIVPGTGGCEFYAQKLLEKGCVLFGLQRVPGVARIKKRGKSVYMTGDRKELKIAALPVNRVEEICRVFEDLIQIPCIPLPNYLSVTLIPSNPILHTTRLYSMFRDYHEGMFWPENIRFYKTWTDDSSEILFACDAELQAMCKKYAGLDLTEVVSLKVHYESPTVSALTAKIQSIPGFQTIESPMVKTESGYIPDFKSRYFVEDYPYGLCIIKDFCCIAGMEMPAIDEVLKWYEKQQGVEYFTTSGFDGKDLEHLPLPRKFGLKTIEDVVAFYQS